MIYKVKESILNPEETKKLNKWKTKLEKARLAYSDELQRMKRREDYYNGTKIVNGNPNNGIQAKKKAINVRNIVYELVESQVDSSIPAPKVIPIHKGDEEAARIIEMFLQNEMQILHMNELNDIDERVTYIQGGDFFHVEWDNKKGYHCTIGDLSISERHPRQVIPQPGVTDIEKMDYIFIQYNQTKEFVKTKYGIDVSDAFKEESFNDTEENTTDTDLVTVNTVYYRNNKNGIGLFIWCDEYILLDLEDYQARRLERCSKCGKIKTKDICPECGSKKFKSTVEEYETLSDDIDSYSGFINSIIDVETEEILEDGTVNKSIKREGVKVPYYKPNVFPIIVRKNVSNIGKLLGYSDVDTIEDQQDAISKIGSKIQEKILAGGSILTLPEGKQIEISDKEYNVVRVNQADKNLIGVVTTQANISQDLEMLVQNYTYAKSTLGVTDAYQGKYDPSAQSGTAKQYSINQAAGRLESKRILKNLTYSKLYEMMFKFALAYADQKIPISYTNSKGEKEFEHFDRYKFLKKDSAGEYYWNDEFIFCTDPTSTLMMNREAMWSQIDLKLQSGAFGPVGDLQTSLLYWQLMEKASYPGAGDIKTRLEERMYENSQQIIEEGGEKDVMSIMQG